MAKAKLRTKRASSIRPAPNAVSVLANTMGFTTGAASRKATPTRNGSPLASSRRTTTTIPHSHTGSAMPSAAPASAPSTGWRGISRASASGRTNTSTNPDARAPASRNGAASMKIPRKIVVKVCSRSGTDTGATNAASIDACRVAVNHATSSARVASTTAQPIQALRPRRADSSPLPRIGFVRRCCNDIGAIIALLRPKLDRCRGGSYVPRRGVRP